MKFIFTILVLFLLRFSNFAQNKTENVFLITTDGLRWQEVFGGADSTLIYNKIITADSSKTFGKFWAGNPLARREKLMPFLWNTIAKKGQIYGNRWAGNKVDVVNPYFFSYPGYNEILSGYADQKVNSNDKIYNENITFWSF